MTLSLLTMLGLASILAVPVAGGPFSTIKPEKAVMRAAAAAPEGVNGVFEMTVRATGHAQGKFFLNSQSDYRDPRNLSVAMTEQTAVELRQRVGATSDSFFMDRKIFVKGMARQVKVYFTDSDGHVSDKYYYQTHVPVAAAVQISVRDKL
jgi:saccharopine dehydrogenase-like NADP-dependent oxidoreductase